MAQSYNLRVTVNTIFDVTPQWLFVKYPDAKRIIILGLLSYEIVSMITNI